MHVGYGWSLHAHQRHRQIAIAGGEHQHAIGDRLLGCSLGVCVGGFHSQGDADVSRLHHIAGSGCPGDGGPVGRPLVGDGAVARQPIRIDHAGLQGFANGCQTREHHRTRRVGGGRGWWQHRCQSARREAEQSIAELQLLHIDQHIHPLSLGGAIDHVLIVDGVVAQPIAAAASCIHGGVDIRAAIEQIIAAVAFQVVIACTPKHLVVAETSHDDVVSATGIHRVVAGLQVEVFVFAGAAAVVIAVRAPAGIRYHP